MIHEGIVMNVMISKSRQSQHGLAMVEAIIVLPLILLLGLAIAEFGRMIMFYNTLNKAQQDGATYIAREAIEGDNDLIILVADGNMLDTANLIVYGEINGFANGATPVLDGLSIDDVVVEVEPDPLLPGYVRISVSYHYTPILGDVLTFLGLALDSAGLDFKSSITVRALG